MVQITVKVDGMMCEMCESHVNDAIRREFKVKKVTSSHAKGETIILSEDSLDENKIKDVINKTGYTASAITTEPYKKKGFFSNFKK